MHTQSIDYVVAGTNYVGYLALPDAAHGALRPGVLVCHEGNGLGPQVKDRVHLLAERGYVAFACDYVGGGEVLPDLPSMMAKLGALRGNAALVRELARAGLAQLLARPEVDAQKVAAIGYCFGGTFALELARDGAPLACTVGFHAGLAPLGPTGTPRGPVLVCTGANDPLVPPAERAAFEDEMRAAGADWRHEIYGNAVHGFANPLADLLGNPAVSYHAPSHRRSWHSMLALFDEVFA